MHGVKPVGIALQNFGSPPAQVVGADIEGVFYDVDTAAPSKSNLQATGVGSVIGIAQKPNTGLLYAVNTNGQVYTFRRSDGAVNLLGRIGPAGLGFDEGDIDIDPTTGIMYLATRDQLYTVDLSTVSSAGGAGLTLVGNVQGANDISGMAFNNNGDLWVIDEATDELMQLDKSNANIMFSSTNLLGPLLNDDLASLAFHPVSGDLVYIAQQAYAILDTAALGTSFVATSLSSSPFFIHLETAQSSPDWTSVTPKPYRCPTATILSTATPATTRSTATT